MEMARLVYDHTLNMNGGCVTPAALLRMFRASELRWHMHPAQLFSLEIQCFIKHSEVSTEVKAEDVPKELLKTPDYTVLGIPVQLRDDYPMAWIRLYAGKTLISAMENLAIPSTFCKWGDWDKYQAEENEKARVIREADAKEM